ncbi:hypothetical protein STRAU_5403 [Streptomyces aurantiacus JA 4570]|uniref:Uncharacterized protein n=1 Tax=Streptomyces aurantiacus JA 4570 TaxID=1286094 RepID=S3ZT11_9ACTN|nr:hypothetical protein STRAU_5403 [Streptomyces aurantiacus JA 4570]
MPRRRERAVRSGDELRRHVTPRVLDDPRRPVQHVVSVTADELGGPARRGEAARDFRTEGDDRTTGHGLVELGGRLVPPVVAAGHSAQARADQHCFHAVRLCGSPPLPCPESHHRALARPLTAP